jgi:hypothetical protein
MQASIDRLQTLNDQMASLTSRLKPFEQQQQEMAKLFQQARQQHDEWAKRAHVVLDAIRKREEAYDRRQFRRYKVEFDDWKSLLLAKVKAKGMPRELESLTQEQSRAIVRLLDKRWQRYMAMPMRDWHAVFRHGRPKARLSPQEAKALATRKVSLAQRSDQLAKGDKRKARRLRYAARKMGVHKKVER